MLERPGNYLGTITDSSVVLTKNGFVQFVADLDITQERTGVGFSPMEEHHRMRAYYILTGSKGVIESKAKSLRDALGWDGSFSSLGETSWRGREVSLSIGWEPRLDGTTELRVQWFNSPDKKPVEVLSAAGADELKRLDAQFGASMRAMLGVKPGSTAARKPSAPAPAPTPAPARPQAPARTASMLPPPPPPPPTKHTIDGVWKRFQEECEKQARQGRKTDPKVVNAEFLELLEKLFPGIADKDLTEQNLGEAFARIPAFLGEKWTPPASAGPDDKSIPF